MKLCPGSGTQYPAYTDFVYSATGETSARCPRCGVHVSVDLARKTLVNHVPPVPPLRCNG